jgi:rubrerythrin
MRLIDADALLENYNLKDMNKYNEDYSLNRQATDTLMLYEIADMIKDTPTAYDVDRWNIPENAKPRNYRYYIQRPETNVEFIDKWKCGKCGGDLLMNFVCCPYCQAIVDWEKE